MIKAIIFDSDGMVTPSKRFSDDLEAKFGISLQKSILFFKNEFQKCLIGEADLKEEFQKYLKKWECDKSVDFLIKYWFESQKDCDAQVLLKIKELQSMGIKCYLATNQEKYRTEYMKNEMGFEDIFDEIFSSAEIGLKKPDQTFFEYIYKKINKNNIFKNEIMFWDDEPKHIEQANKYGFNSFVYKNFIDFKDILNKFI